MRLASLNHFLANEWDRKQAQKRGGGVTIIPLEMDSAEGYYRTDRADLLTPEKLFERRWALTVIDLTLKRLEEEFTDNGRGRLDNANRNVFTDGRAWSLFLVGLLDSGIYSALALRGPWRSLILSTLCKSFELVEFYEEEAIVISTLTGVFQKWNSPLNREIILFREPRAPSPHSPIQPRLTNL